MIRNGQIQYYVLESKRRRHIVGGGKKMNNIIFAAFAAGAVLGILAAWKYSQRHESEEEPYVISADEFGFFEDFETIMLIYYADDILADDADHIIEDKDETVGGDALSRLRNIDDEDETVYVRDEKRKVDYEICYVYKAFVEVAVEQPKGYANG